MDGHEWYDQDGWHYQPPSTSGGSALTLALLEDLSHLLTVHGYAPLSGYPLAELAAVLTRLPRAT
ncbi:MAG: hypothetical protein JF597_48285 [Streptomyces sp.]|uniref:hypothetical protein n=1 Tax=Streptomyces sp. TaxID=1931 RepID=UPI0025CCD6EF|nr:hypothetical protein [Streptomyces sp.]MBW8801076.1 hypothetical protein [Streptomyces sp.]